MKKPPYKQLLAGLGCFIGLSATPAMAIEFSDLTFTGLMLPTDAAVGGEIIVGWDAGVSIFGALVVNDFFLYDLPTNTFYSTGINITGGPGTMPEVSHDGTRVPGTILSPDFGGDSGTSLDGPFTTAGVWVQTPGQPLGTGTRTDLLAIDSPVGSEAYKNYVLNILPPSSFDLGLGRSNAISGNGNVVTGNYFRKDTPGTNGGMPAIYDIAGGTTTSLSPGLSDNKGEVLTADFDGNVVAGYTNNPFIPTVWVNGVEAQLTHPNGTSGRATSLNDAGTVLAGYQRVVMPDTNLNTQGQVVWHYIAGNDTWRRTTIGRLPGQTAGLAEATGISGDGKIVVGFDDAKTLVQGGTIAGSGDNGQGTFWTYRTGLVNIEDFLTARGLDLTGIEIASIQGISPDGNTLLTWAYTGNTINDITGLIIDVSSTPLNPEATQALLDTATANLGTSAPYVGDNYYGDWTRDGQVTKEDLNLIGYLLNGFFGDLDLDGDVDDADFGVAFAAFTGPNLGPSANPDADLDADSDVDDADFGIAFSNFTGPGATASVPEPTSLLILGISGLLITRRRHA